MKILNSSKQAFTLSLTHVRIFKLAIHLIALSLLVYNYYLAFTDQLGGDPVEAILHFTGITAFNFIILGLLISPVARWFKQNQLMRARRIIGIWAFIYAAFHFGSFILFELQLEWGLLIKEIIDRPYITVGFVALLILTALAATSVNKIQRKMGRSWQVLHHWVYIAAALVALHYIWSVKSDILQPMVYIAIVSALLLVRKDRLLKFYSRTKN